MFLTTVTLFLHNDKECILTLPTTSPLSFPFFLVTQRELKLQKLKQDFKGHDHTLLLKYNTESFCQLIFRVFTAENGHSILIKFCMLYGMK